nr:MAG: hypothetical protein [Microviridae sp.]
MDNSRTATDASKLFHESLDATFEPDFSEDQVRDVLSLMRLLLKLELIDNGYCKLLENYLLTQIKIKQDAAYKASYQGQ